MSESSQREPFEGATVEAVLFEFEPAATGVIEVAAEVVEDVEVLDSSAEPSEGEEPLVEVEVVEVEIFAAIEMVDQPHDSGAAAGRGQEQGETLSAESDDAPAGADTPADADADVPAGAGAGAGAEADTEADHGAQSVGMTEAPAEPVVLVPDPLLLAARDVARAALAEITDPNTIGSDEGYEVHESQVLSLFFECRLTGYPGWHWAATLSRLDGSDEVNVLEVELLPGSGSVVAPDWVPWSERLSQYRESQARQAADEAAAAEAAAAELDDVDDLDAEDDLLDNDFSDFDDEIDGVDIDDLDAFDGASDGDDVDDSDDDDSDDDEDEDDDESDDSNEEDSEDEDSEDFDSDDEDDDGEDSEDAESDEE